MQSNYFAGVVLTLGLCLTQNACNKADATSGSDPCAGATYKHPNPSFCIKAPPGFAPGQTQVVGKETRLHFDRNGGTESFTVSWGSYASLADAEPFIKGMLDDPEHEKKGGGDVAGRKGKYYWVSFKGEGLGQAEVYVQGKNQVFDCYVNATDEHIKEQVDACLTLYAP